MLHIPEHTKCTNCGECCGPIMGELHEVKRIKEYFNNLPEEYKEQLKNQKREPLDCQFRDHDNKKCAVYKVRPIICRLMGVTEGMKCPNGNTTEIDGHQFMGKTCIMMPPMY